jgi:hypothetical protein
VRVIQQLNLGKDAAYRRQRRELNISSDFSLEAMGNCPTQQVTLIGSGHFLYGSALKRFQLFPHLKHVVGIFRGCLAWRISLLDP